MNKANIMIARDNDGYNIKVEGRATFECCSPIKNFADNLITGIIKNICIDLKTCTWMDSTFMGTLATLGLHAKKAGVVVNILNANDKNIKLLKELGIHKLFNYDSSTPKTPCNAWENITNQPSHKNKRNIARTVLEAHETLISVEEKNYEKFKKVVVLVKKDLDTDNEQEK